MNPLNLALKYMQIVYKSEDYDQLNEILREDCIFSGSLYTFNSAQSYIDSLKKDPPNDFKYEIVNSYQDNNSACLIYNFRKPGIKTKMAQVFEISQNKITTIQLIFDVTPFLNNKT